MGDLSNKIKQLTTNKNTVTVLGVFLAIIVLYLAYIMRVNADVSPISIPYAREQISPGIKITEDYIGMRDVPPAMLKGDVIRDYGAVINKYSNMNSVIPEGSLFYKSQVVEKEQVSSNAILNYPTGYVPYYMNVTSFTTYGNSIYPGNYIDIYLKAVDKVANAESMTSDADRVMLGKLLENVKVLAVLDADGKNVFSDLDNRKVPEMIVFAVPSEYYSLLKRSEKLAAYDSTLIPVPTNESVKDKQGKLKLSSEKLKEWINRVTIVTET